MATKKVRITDSVQAVLNYGISSAPEGEEFEVDADLADSMIRAKAAVEAKPKRKSAAKKSTAKSTRKKK